KQFFSDHDLSNKHCWKSYFSSTIKCGPFGRSRLHLMSLTLSASSILKFAMQNSRKNSQKKIPFVKKN
ncbi:hypothetical protein, partial [Escherichia coli]|uniref:hypothetical protein n=1 Tax=Escherichia coli TaxID=562 RepID=UPI001CDAFF72